MLQRLLKLLLRTSSRGIRAMIIRMLRAAASCTSKVFSKASSATLRLADTLYHEAKRNFVQRTPEKVYQQRQDPLHFEEKRSQCGLLKRKRCEFNSREEAQALLHKQRNKLQKLCRKQFSSRTEKYRHQVATGAPLDPCKPKLKVIPPPLSAAKERASLIVVLKISSPRLGTKSTTQTPALELSSSQPETSKISTYQQCLESPASEACRDTLLPRAEASDIHTQATIVAPSPPQLSLSLVTEPLDWDLEPIHNPASSTSPKLPNENPTSTTSSIDETASTDGIPSLAHQTGRGMAPDTSGAKPKGPRGPKGGSINSQSSQHRPYDRGDRDRTAQALKPQAEKVRKSSDTNSNLHRARLSQPQERSLVSNVANQGNTTQAIEKSTDDIAERYGVHIWGLRKHRLSIKDGREKCHEATVRLKSSKDALRHVDSMKQKLTEKSTALRKELFDDWIAQIAASGQGTKDITTDEDLTRKLALRLQYDNVLEQLTELDNIKKRCQKKRSTAAKHSTQLQRNLFQLIKEEKKLMVLVSGTTFRQ